MIYFSNIHSFSLLLFFSHRENQAHNITYLSSMNFAMVNLLMQFQPRVRCCRIARTTKMATTVTAIMTTAIATATKAGLIRTLQLRMAVLDCGTLYEKIYIYIIYINSINSAHLLVSYDFFFFCTSVLPQQPNHRNFSVKSKFSCQ